MLESFNDNKVTDKEQLAKLQSENERFRRALQRIALNTHGDLPAQVIAGDTLSGREPGT